MATELEKQFFSVFGIEPKCETRDEYHKHECYGMVDCDECASAIYPQISDKQYLELICILGYFEIVYKPDNCEELKKYILKYYLNLDDSEIRELKHQVQAIFEGER